jgi:hypothetical protein
MEDLMNSNWLQIMSNPAAHVIKQFMEEFLKDQYPPHQEILERISKSLVTANDLDAFNKLVSAIYQIGYMKAVKDHAEALAQIGYKTKFVQPADNSIFPQEKSG